MYTYRAELDRVIDGDTVDLKVDLGFNVWIHERFRLVGIDTPELRPRKGTAKQRAAEKVRAKAAKARLEEILTHADEILIEVEKGKGKYGRWLGELFIDDVSVNQTLVDEGHAKVYR